MHLISYIEFMIIYEIYEFMKIIITISEVSKGVRWIKGQNENYYYDFIETVTITLTLLIFFQKYHRKPE